MRFGVCYYPEHWPESRWQADARQMRSIGIELVRLGEFAWALMEPAEGQFDWAWLDRAVEILATEGLQIILGTPTAAPPAWVSHQYPEILPVDREGRARRHGGRRHYCPNSPTYHRLSRRIVQEMAIRYGQQAAITGWQIDNEFGGGHTARCYCEKCAVAFQSWLSGRYGSLETLNQAWGNRFWSQCYSEWDQIKPPNLVLGRPNPSHVLDYYRFASDSYAAYQQIQIDALRGQLTAKALITHNFMGHFVDLDYHRLASRLDLATWDSYPTGLTDRHQIVLYGENKPERYPADVGDPHVIGFSHALTFGLLDKPFWVMEQQPGHINWGVHNPGVRDGNIRLWTWQAVAEGAETILFFRWRACLDGQEQYHTGLLNHLGDPDVGYRDLQRLMEEKARLDEISAQPRQADCALLFDYEDLWALDLQPHHGNFNYRALHFTYYLALQKLGIQTAVIPLSADLSPYKLVIAPAVFLDRESLQENLSAYAEAGGRVLLGVRSGFKTPSNRVQETRLPGSFRTLIGAEVTSWEALTPGSGYKLRADIELGDTMASVWAECLQPDPETQVLAWFDSGPHHGTAALTERSVGRGSVSYLGWYPNLAQAQAVLLDIAQKMGLDSGTNLPGGVIKKVRGPYTAYLNFSDYEQLVSTRSQQISIPPRDIKIIRRE